MAFVRGMMGPLYETHSVGASFAMIISLLVALLLIQAAVRLLKSQQHHNKKVKMNKTRIIRQSI